MDQCIHFVLCHEIFGATTAVGEFAHLINQKYGYGLHIPHFLETPIFSRCEEIEAYSSFIQTLGISALSRKLINYCQELRSVYTESKIIVLGLSVGGSAAWLASASGVIDGAVALYGSRIRDHLEVEPRCPVKTIFALGEANFNSQVLSDIVGTIPYVNSTVLNYDHGFCLSDSPTFSSLGQHEAIAQIESFVSDYFPMKVSSL